VRSEWLRMAARLGGGGPWETACRPVEPHQKILFRGQMHTLETLPAGGAADVAAGSYRVICLLGGKQGSMVLLCGIVR
jgi:hypothetical protein